MEIRVELSASLKPKPQDESKLGFGKIFTDHMFIMDYATGKGWHDARVVPYQPITLDPAATCLHYGQLIFEGLKAYRTGSGKIVMFRPEKNMQRLNNSNDRLCMPKVDVDFTVGAMKKLIQVEKDWVPSSPGTSLYIRPFIISTEAFLGVHPSNNYKFMVILAPSGQYYPGGLAPIKINVENEFVRAVRGGTGFTKCAGNYAASLLPQMAAEDRGFAQVLYLDGIERRYVEEVGTSNIFFVFEDEIATPDLNGSILPGITRDSIITLLKSWGKPVNERRVSIDEVAEGHASGRLKEVFGAGTAAVVSPVGELTWGERKMIICGNKIGPLTQKLYDELTGIQRCEKEDKFGWVTEVI